MLYPVTLWLVWQAVSGVANTTPAVAASEQRPATIRGRVISENGVAVRSAVVTARAKNSPRKTATAESGEDGFFTIANIEPDTYALECTKVGFLTTGYRGKETDAMGFLTIQSDQSLEIQCRLQNGAVIAGEVSNASAEPIGGATVKAMKKQYAGGRPSLRSVGVGQTDDHGRFRIYDLPSGRYYLFAGSSGMNRLSYSDTYYPAAVTVAGAQVVEIAAGREVDGIAIKMQQLSTHAVEGLVVDLRSATPAKNVVLTATTEDFGGEPAAFSVTRSDGTFHLGGLAPGRYILAVTYTSSASAFQRLTTSLEVGSEDIKDFRIGIGAEARIKGKLRAEGNALPGGLSVSLRPRVPFPMGHEDQAPVEVDGTFEFTGIQTGNYDLVVRREEGAQTKPPPYFLSSVVLGGQDVTDTGIPVPVGGDLDVSAILDFRGGAIQGVALDLDQKPFPGVIVVLASADSAKLRLERYFRYTRSDPNGVFNLTGVVPGDYCLAIWPADEAGSLQDPDMFAVVRSHMTSVSIRESEKTTQNVKLASEVLDIVRNSVR